MSAAQGSDAWLMERLGLATASRFSSVMATIKSGEAAERRNYRAQLVVERLTKKPTVGYVNDAMRAGLEREPMGKVEIEARLGLLITDVGFVQHEFLECGASPDGLIGDSGGLELKCPQPATHFEYLRLKSGECPSDYWWQIQGGMWLTKRQWWYFASYCPEYPDGLRLIMRTIKRDDTAISSLESSIKKFMEEVREAEIFARNYVEPIV